MQPQNRPPDGTTSVLPVDRLLELVALAYEAAVAAADNDLLDFSLIGAPLAEAIALLRDEVAA